MREDEIVRVIENASKSLKDNYVKMVKTANHTDVYLSFDKGYLAGIDSLSYILIDLFRISKQLQKNEPSKAHFPQNKQH